MNRFLLLFLFLNSVFFYVLILSDIRENKLFVVLTVATALLSKCSTTCFVSFNINRSFYTCSFVFFSYFDSIVKHKRLAKHKNIDIESLITIHCDCPTSINEKDCR